VPFAAQLAHHHGDVLAAVPVRHDQAPGVEDPAGIAFPGVANSWLTLTVLGAAPWLGPMPPLPVGDEPGPFAFADPAHLHRVLGAAGFVDVTVENADVTITAPDDPEGVAEWLIEVGPAARPIGGPRRTRGQVRDPARPSSSSGSGPPARHITCRPASW
jgi:hypothetical protein